jgi:16S rRNA (adenine1518-N6/adenine1519-N6)-dimethyltransferase
MSRDRREGERRAARPTPEPSLKAGGAGEGGEAYGRPKRSLGQNFLSDPNTAAKIVAALAIAPGDVVVEIGPGRGALTPFILDAGPAAYLALEKDRDLAVRLAREHPGASVAMTDALRMDWRRLDRLPGARVIGNLPYNIASPLLWDLCAGAVAFARGVFMVQHEVARRLAASPGGREYGALSAWVGSFARVEYCFKVPPTVFRPRPKVDSAVVAVTPRPAAERPAEPAALSRLLKMLFSLRRKQLGGILKPFRGPELDAWLAENGVSERDRPENLSPPQLSQLSILLKKRLGS